MMLHHSNCPLCNSSEINLFLNCTDYLVSRKRFSLFKCDKCNFIFTGDYPEETESGKYYESEDYISHTDSDKSLFEKIYRTVRKRMLRRKNKIVTRETGIVRGNILDIGCGTGHFLKEMKQAGWLSRGVEISNKAREYAVSRFGLEVISPAELTSLKGKTFDCITLWHVLEHLHNPDNWFEQIRQLLTGSGKLIIALPNSYSFDAAHYKDNWAAWDVPRHLWHFSPETFMKFAVKKGFKITGLKTLPFDVYYISVLSEKNKGSSLPFISGMVKGFYFSLRSLINRRRSSSLIYILQVESN